MPFTSHAQESYLKRNEPEVYREWVRKYGRYKGKILRKKDHETVGGTHRRKKELLPRRRRARR